MFFDKEDDNVPANESLNSSDVELPGDTSDLSLLAQESKKNGANFGAVKPRSATPPGSPKSTIKMCPPSPSPNRTVTNSPYVTRKVKANLFPDAKPKAEKENLEPKIGSRVPNITVTATSPNQAMETDKGISEMSDLIISPRRKQIKSAKTPTANINPFSPARRRASFLREEEESQLLSGAKHIPSASFSPIAQVPQRTDPFDPEIQMSPKYSKYRTEFIEKETIGTGSFGTVYKCLNRIDGWIYAVKISKRKFKGKADREQKLKEVYAMAALGQNHHLVRYYGAWIEDEQLYIQTEFCAGGSLASQLENGALFSEDQLIDVLRQVGEGLFHIHSQNMVHLDIKPENIFQTNNQFKIGDFGLISEVNEKVIEEGDCRYLPLELLEQRSIDSELHKADVFSLGITIYELITRKPLPPRDTAWRALREGKLLDFPPTLSEEFVQLVKKMMSYAPVDRPSIAEILQHPLLHRQSPIHKISKLKEKVKISEEELEHRNKRICILEKELELRDSQERKRIQDLEQMVMLLIQKTTGTPPPVSQVTSTPSMLSPSLSPSIESNSRSSQFLFSPPSRLDL